MASRPVVVDDTTCMCGVCRDQFPDVDAFDVHRRQRGRCVPPAQPQLPIVIPSPRRRPAR